jgi:hypothetical protein
MNIQLLPIADLKPSEYNPRKITTNEKKRILESFKEFGIVQPAVINANKERLNVIIGGHQRISVALEKGETHYPCVLVDLTLEQEKRLNLKLNKISGEWDIEKLYHNFELPELIDVGFSKFDLDLKFARIDNKSIFDVKELTESAPKTAFSTPDTYYANNEELLDTEQENGKEPPSNTKDEILSDKKSEVVENSREKPVQGSKFYPLSIVLESEEHAQWLALKQSQGVTSDKALLLKLMFLAR